MKSFKYILLLWTVLASTSCDSFLVETPTTSVGKEGVYNSISSARAALAGCYAMMTGYNGYAFNYFHVLSVSSGMGVSIKSNDVNLTTMTVQPSDVNMTNTYNGLYETIKVANDIIDGMQTSTIADVAEKNRITGEGYLIRALSYFNLVRLFGPVSLITKPVTSYEEAQQPRAAVEAVYTLITSDLETAFNLLPLPADRVEGHPHRYAAQALLAKVYLTMAGDDAASIYWQKAYTAGKDVVDNGGYTLVRPYAKLFGSPNKNNQESIIELQFSSMINSGRLTETSFPIGHDLMSNISAEGKSWGKTRPTQRAYSQFDVEDPRRDASFVHTSYKNIFEKDAKKQTVLLYPTTKADGLKKKMVYKQGDSEYAAWKKYYDPAMTASASNANFVYYRYADLLLVLAEAANEIGSADAADYLDQVLDRARDIDGSGTIDRATEVYPLPVSAAEKGDKALLRERIFRERLKELTGECDEWYTIRRRGAVYLKKVMEEHNAHVEKWYADQKLKPENVKFVYTYVVNDENVKKNLLLPFPADEIARNEAIGQEDQNYGY